MPANAAAAAGEGQIEEFTIFSNYGKTIGVEQGAIELIITESILDNTVRVKYTYADTGYGQGREVATVEKEDLNLTSAEKVHLVVKDGYDNKISFKGDYHLRIENIINAEESARNLVNVIYMCSEESIKNEWLKTRVVSRYDGKIPDHVIDILKNVLKTPKKVSVDPGLNNFVFTGKSEKPFSVCPYLAKRCIPDFGPPGKYAGYFFWETSDDGKGSGGYNFKSLDKLTQQGPKLKLVYTGNRILPPGYDVKIERYSFDNTIKLDKILKTGTYVKSHLRTLSTYDNKYKESNFSDTERLSGGNIMGTEPPKIGTDIKLQDEPTRISASILQDDVSNTGPNLKKQLEVSKGKYINYPVEKIIRQSFTRYNNMFGIRLSVIIPGRFDLHAGDLVFCDFPEISSKKIKLVSDKKSGLYMIVDVGHRISKNSCYTTLNLTRESIYRKG